MSASLGQRWAGINQRWNRGLWFLLMTLALIGCSPVDALQHNPDTQISLADICGLPVSAMSGNFYMVIAAGLLSGFSHCAGMCGPLVMVFTSLRRRVPGADATNALVAFQAGRLAMYVLLGQIMGLLGATIRVGVVEVGWQSRISVVIGALLLLTGLGLWGAFPWMRSLENAPWGAALRDRMRRLIQSQNPLAPFALGVCNGLLPCGSLYVMLSLAATTASPIQGGLVMFAFGLGTLPALLGIGFAAGKLGGATRSHLFRFGATLVMAVGLQLTLRGLAYAGQVPHMTLGGVSLW